jgi:hypothetical protein
LLKNSLLDCLGSEISKLIEEHSPCHLFLDEAPASDLSPEVWSDIHRNFPKEKFLWVAYRADALPHDDAVEGKFTGTQNTIWSSYRQKLFFCYN